MSSGLSQVKSLFLKIPMQNTKPGNWQTYVCPRAFCVWILRVSNSAATPAASLFVCPATTGKKLVPAGEFGFRQSHKEYDQTCLLIWYSCFWHISNEEYNTDIYNTHIYFRNVRDEGPKTGLNGPKQGGRQRLCWLKASINRAIYILPW